MQLAVVLVPLGWVAVEVVAQAGGALEVVVAQLVSEEPLEALVQRQVQLAVVLVLLLQQAQKLKSSVWVKVVQQLV